MSVFTKGNLSFCELCGTLLPMPDEKDLVTCPRCSTQRPTADYEGITSFSQSRTYAFQKPKFNTKKVTKGHAATIKEKCPKCGREEMTFTTAQLRSADEGQTIFYSCECGYKFNVNS